MEADSNVVTPSIFEFDDEFSLFYGDNLLISSDLNYQTIRSPIVGPNVTSLVLSSGSLTQFVNVRIWDTSFELNSIFPNLVEIVCDFGSIVVYEMLGLSLPNLTKLRRLVCSIKTGAGYFNFFKCCGKLVMCQTGLISMQSSFDWKLSVYTCV